MTTYKDVALHLFDAGYEPLPVVGKKPHISDIPSENVGWTEHLIDRKQVEQWRQNGLGRCSTGIRLGTIQAIDVDVYDESAAKRIAQWIDTSLGDGVPLPRRFGRVPKFLIPCVIDGVDAKMVSTRYEDDYGRVHQIEVLARGQHFVAYGLHEETKQPYRWVNGDLLTVPAADLLQIGRDDIEWLFMTFDEIAEELGWSIAGRKKERKERVLSDDPFADYVAPPSFEELSSAVSMIPMEAWDDYDDWVMVGMAIHHATNGSAQGMQLWLDGSKRSAKFKNEEEIEFKWKSFSTGRDPGEAVTYASIIGLLCDYFDIEEVKNRILAMSQTSQTSQPSRTSASVTTMSQIASQTNGAISGEVDEYIYADPGSFTLSQIYHELGYQKKAQKDACRKVLQRRVEMGVLQKDPMKRGTYMIVTNDIEEIEWGEDEEPVLPLRLPLGLSNYFDIIMGNVIVIAGATNAGKTLMAMNILRTWTEQLVTLFGCSLHTRKITPSLRSFLSEGVNSGKNSFPERFIENFSGIRYVNAEMTRSELVNTVKFLGPNHKDVWNNVQWIKRNHNFQQVVLPGGITVIDYLQIYDDFYKIGAFIRDIADRLETGIAIVLIQMQRGAKVPRGGDFALERCRLGLSLDRVGPDVSSCLIAKGKNVKKGARTIQDAYIDYRFGDDAYIKPITEPMFLSDKDRQKLNAQYQADHRAKEARNDFIDNEPPF